MRGSESEDSTINAGQDYHEALAGEGEYWDSFMANRLLEHEEIPGSVDFRLFFTQFSWKHGWGPPCLGPIAINFREREIRYILTQAARQRGMRVLDLGCGAGWLSLELARQGAHVTAIDISPTNLALGRYMVETNERNFPFLYQGFAGLPCALENFGSVEYVFGDLNTVELPKNEYDAVVVWDSLHHVKDLPRLLEQVRGALKSEGIFVGVDHAFATALTVTFNEALAPWLKDLDAWVSEANPEWLYEFVNETASRRDWDVLQVDRGVKPIPAFEGFEGQVRREMLEIIRSGLRQEQLDNIQARVEARGEGHAGETSPFEDVSAQSVMVELIERFQAVQFRTLCPLVMPEQYFTPPRSEAERIFQHYVSATLVEICERAVVREQADGQWFLFHLTPQRPDPAQLSPELQRIRESRSADHVSAMLRLGWAERVRYVHERLEHLGRLEEAMAEHSRALDELRGYTAQVQGELERKNVALSELEDYVRRLEAELAEVRKPRLPWKRGVGTGIRGQG